MDQSRHLRDIKLLLAILVVAALLAGYVYVQSMVDETNRDTDRQTQQLREAGRDLGP